jgi:hypothetical protein
VWAAIFWHFLTAFCINVLERVVNAQLHCVIHTAKVLVDVVAVLYCANYITKIVTRCINGYWQVKVQLDQGLIEPLSNCNSSVRPLKELTAFDPVVQLEVIRA